MLTRTPSELTIGRGAHREHHFRGSEIVRDAVLGVADGLTVPFALAAGLSAAATSNDVIVIAGIAEIAAGAIAMGLGGYLSAQSQRQHYHSERSREEREIELAPETELDEVREIFRSYGLDGRTLEVVTQSVTRDKNTWVDFMMKFELGLEEPLERRAAVSGMTIATAYVVGGLIPLLPYVTMDGRGAALWFSTVATSIALTVFGLIKARLSGAPLLRSTLQTVIVGALAAFVAYGLAKALT